MYAELTAGYHVDPVRLLNGAVFDVDYSEMVVVKDIPFYSLCEHHLLPFFGKAHVAYLPNGKIIGLSKIPRIVDIFARRLQVQERLTRQIAETIQDLLNPKGVAVVVECVHLLHDDARRGKQNSVALTSCMLGARPTRAAGRNLNLVRGR
jgi:GTP cyclohydrolase I